MAGFEILDTMMYQKMDPMKFDFDQLSGPSVYNYFSPTDIQALNGIAMSSRIRVKKKYNIIEGIMAARGFRRYAAGTNRVTYACYENPNIVAKVAIDKVAIRDNTAEFINQQEIKPFCAKTFSVSPCGVIAICEKVIPVTSIDVFDEISDAVFDIIVYKLLRKHVMDDIGVDYFMNWGIRPGFAPVLLDYPYMYKCSAKKLVCKATLDDGTVCGGRIAYNAGFNHLHCTKCGKLYSAYDVKADDIIERVKPIPNTKKGMKRGMDITITTPEGKKNIAIPDKKMTQDTKPSSEGRLKPNVMIVRKGDKPEEKPVKDIPDGFEPVTDHIIPKPDVERDPPVSFEPPAKDKKEDELKDIVIDDLTTTVSNVEFSSGNDIVTRTPTYIEKPEPVKPTKSVVQSSTKIRNGQKVNNWNTPASR